MTGSAGRLPANGLTACSTRTFATPAGILSFTNQKGNKPLMLFFKVGPNPQEWWGELILSYDRGRSFQSAQRLPEGIDGPVRSKPIRLKDGALLCPSSTEHGDDWRFHFEKLNDGKWSRVEPKQQLFQVIQPTLLNHPDQRIQALYRSKHGAIITNESKERRGKLEHP
jgi:hypothetical protein